MTVYRRPAATNDGDDPTRVLVIGDELATGDVLRKVLENHHCQILTAIAEEEALPLLQEVDIAVALVNLALSGTEDLQLVRKIKEISADTEVLVLTSRLPVDLSARAISEGAYDCLGKPFDDLHQVSTTVSRALEKHSLSRGYRNLLIEQERRNRELSTAARRLSAMIEAGRALGDFYPLPELLDRFTALVAEQLGVDRVSLMLLDESGEYLGISSSRGLEGIQPESIRVPLGEGVAGSVARSGKPFLVQDSGRDPRLGCPPRSGLSGSFMSAPILMSVPIKSSGHVLGVINATNRRSGEPFNEQDLSYLTGLAGQLATAIQRTRHFEDLQGAYRSLKEAQGQLIRSERIKALGQIAAGVAHDFNNALSVVLSRSESLLDQLERGESDVRSLVAGLDAIRRVSLQGAEAIRRIQDYTRMRKDTPDTTVDLNAVVHEAIEITRPKWKEECEARGALVQIVPDLVPIPPITGNVQELTQVVSNMIINAVEAMPAGGNLSFRTGAEGENVVLAISDTGVGMSEETRRRLFEPFFTTKATGQGLGTSIIYGIVTRHHGEIDVASSEGCGTTFRLRFPAAESRAADRGTQSERSAASDLSGRRLLLVEDDDLVRETFREILVAHGLEVTCASGGGEALALFERGRFDVLVTDLSMPGMSGFELARGVKGQDPSIPVLLLSGWSVQLDEESVVEAGIDHVLMKPCPTSQLIAELRKALAGREAVAISTPWSLARILPSGGLSGRSRRKSRIQRSSGRDKDGRQG